MRIRRQGRDRLAGLGTAVVVATVVAVGTAPQAPAAAPTLKTTAAWRTDPRLVGLKPVTGPAARDWLASGTLPGGGTRFAGMVRDALLDLRRLSSPTGAVAAGAAPHWAYTWPRDASFSVAAMLATGHRREALDTLAFLAAVQHDDGGFAARYLLDGSGVPDRRQPQTDGAGWTLWGLGRVLATAPDPGQARRELIPLLPLLDRATGFVLAQTGSGRRLPAASPDYWEQPERRVTLGTAAPLLAGLRASQQVYAALGLAAAADRSGGAARRFEQVVRLQFAPGGYQRYAGWGGHDAAVCLLLPPFTAAVEPAVLTAWRDYRREAARPAGGVAPGAAWKRDGVSWTPETALVAYTAASMGDRATAEELLGWLDAHRTRWGSLPEKVLADGRPAGPAPLGWTAAAVVLTAAALDG